MTYKEANEIIENNKHLIGKEYKGARIDELIIRPINDKQFQEFAKLYIRSSNPEIAIAPFRNQDVTVSIVCEKHKIRTSSIFLQTEIHNIEKEGLEVNL